MTAVTAVLAIGILNSYEALRDDPIEVVPSGRLQTAFFALPWEGEDAVNVTPLAEPKEAWVARWKLVRDAERTIDVAYFILKGDVFGLSFLGALLEAADRGVAVRVLVDGLATDMAGTTDTLTGDNFLRVLAAHPEIEVRASRPQFERVGSFLLNLEAGSLIASEHDKMLNVDGQWTLTGGRNIAVDYFTPIEHPGKQFLDLDVLVESDVVVARMRTAFERLYESADPMNTLAIELLRRETVERAHERMQAWLEAREPVLDEDRDWRKLDRELQEDLTARPELRGALDERAATRSFAARARVVDSTTRETPAPGEITRTVTQFVAESKTEITLVSPYLVLGEGLTAALAQAAERGVRIQVLTNSPLSSDNAISQALFLEQWPTLLARVPTLELFVYGGEDTLHTKLLLFDDEVSLVGTYNLDPTAMHMNSELMVALWSAPLNRHFRRQVAKRIDPGPPAVHRYRIERAPDGSALLDARGAPRVQFGPEHHLSPAQLEPTRAAQRLIGGIQGALGLDPLLRMDPADAPGAPSNQTSRMRE